MLTTETLLHIIKDVGILGSVTPDGRGNDHVKLSVMKDGEEMVFFDGVVGDPVNKAGMIFRRLDDKSAMLRVLDDLRLKALKGSISAIAYQAIDNKGTPVFNWLSSDSIAKSSLLGAVSTISADIVNSLLTNDYQDSAEEEDPSA